MGFFNLPTVINQIREGKLKALAVTGKTRSGFLPQLPTLVEAGLTDFDVGAWFGFAAPAGTPADFGQLMRDDLARWLSIVKASGAVAQ